MPSLCTDDHPRDPENDRVLFTVHQPEQGTLACGTYLRCSECGGAYLRDDTPKEDE